MIFPIMVGRSLVKMPGTIVLSQSSPVCSSSAVWCYLHLPIQKAEFPSSEYNQKHHDCSFCVGCKKQARIMAAVNDGPGVGFLSWKCAHSFFLSIGRWHSALVASKQARRLAVWLGIQLRKQHINKRILSKTKVTFPSN